MHRNIKEGSTVVAERREEAAVFKLSLSPAAHLLSLETQ